MLGTLRLCYKQRLRKDEKNRRESILTAVCDWLRYDVKDEDNNNRKDTK